MRIIEDKRRAILGEMEAGRGSGNIFSHPVPLEPPYSPYNTHPLRRTEHPFFKRIFKETVEGPLSVPTIRDNVQLRFITIKPSKEDETSLESVEQFILSLPGSQPISFEIIGSGNKIYFQTVVTNSASDAAISQLRSHLLCAECSLAEDLIKSVLSRRIVARAYRLRQSHFFPLGLAAESGLDPLRSLYGTLSNLTSGAMGMLQILFIPVSYDWQNNIRRASRSPYDPSHSPFVDLPALPKIVDRKLAKPLYAVSIRLMASSEAIISAMQGIFTQFENQENGLIAIPGSYPTESVIARNAFVRGFLINLSELSYFVRLPGPDILASMPIIEQASRSYPVPAEFTIDGPCLGINEYHGVKSIVRHSRTLPNQHVYSCGKSGYGKSNLILSTVIERITEGNGLAVVDPHGALITEGILPRIPKERLSDVIYFNAGDFKYPMAINPLAHSGAKMEKEHIRVDLLDFFEGLFDASLGVNVQHSLNFFIITLLQFDDSTLLDLERLLIDKEWRGNLIDSIQDDRVRMFWKEEFPQLEKRGIITAITNKLSPLILPDSTIAPMLTGRENKINFLKIMNEKKIFLANLSHGDIGKRNSQLLGKLLVSRLQIAAMMREGNFPDFYLFVDEFQHLVTPSMADILSGARKYGLHLWLANQMMGDIPDAIFRHVYNAATMIFFATDSPSDQLTIEKTLSKKFKAEDIGRLKRGETFVKMVNSVFNMLTNRVPEISSPGYVSEIIADSRTRYTTTMTINQEIRNQKPIEITQKQRKQDFDSILSNEEKNFLECAYKNPGLSVTKVYKASGVSAYMGDKLKTALKDKNFAMEVTTHLGQGSRIAKFLLLTPEGFSALDAGFDRGKGGPLHKYWQSIICAQAENLGYAAKVEEPIPSGKEAVDIGLFKDGNKLAIEISVTTPAEHELDNAIKCLKAGYGQIVVLFLDEAKVKEFESLVKTNLTEEDRSKVKSGLAYDFGRFL